jgi:phenylacetate-coenzyme A ligase PaaK-like adenylate-forming protein
LIAADDALTDRRTAQRTFWAFRKDLSRLDALFERDVLGPEPPRERLAIARTIRLALTLELSAAESARARRIGAVAAYEAAAAELRGNAAARPPADELETRLERILERLPHTQPEELVESPESSLCVSQDEVAALTSVPTSGSGGARKRVFSTADDLETIVKFFQYGMLHLVEPGRDRTALLMNGDRPGSVGRSLEEALNRWRLPLLTMGFLDFGKIDDFVSRLIDYGVTCLVGLPSQLLALARSGRPAGRLGETLKTVLLSGEAAPEALKKALTEEWGAEVFVHYGLTEFGLGGAVECGRRGGPHLREADLIAEILDPDDGRRLAPGEIGEIVLTSLTRRAMPLVRYKTGDLGSIDPEPCPCGSIMRRLRPRGRLADRLTTPDGRSVSLLELGEVLAPIEAGWRLFWRSKPPLLRVVALGRAKEESGRNAEEANARAATRSMLAKILGPGAEIEMSAAESWGEERADARGAKNVLISTPAD